MWNAVSLIDENGSFRGEAKFETRVEAEQYLVTYLQRMKDRIKSSHNGEPQVRVFDEGAEPVAPEKADKPRKVKKSTKKRKKATK